ncbi:acetylxylan esterase [Paenibacillaceae bacterium]|nr:acetylxylan esterase [Paenibacillaceae bacterium]
MSFIDKRLTELNNYWTPATAQPDLNDFWERTLNEARVRPLNSRRQQTESLSAYIDAYKISYEGFDDTPVYGWYLLPRFAGSAASDGRLPCVVIYHGYHGSKGTPEQYANWLLLGYAVFAVDVRGQAGETGNLLKQEHGMTAGWITQGITNPEHSYYRAISVDAVKAVEWVAQQPEIDPEQIVVLGTSQGGGLALMAGALSDIPSKIVADVPNMCHMDFGIYNAQGSLTEAASYVSKFPEQLEQVLKTLSYFDLLNLSDRLSVPTMISISLKDPVCMPETIFAVYNQLKVPKRLHVFPFNGHFVSGDHFRRQVEFLRN